MEKAYNYMEKSCELHASREGRTMPDYFKLSYKTETSGLPLTVRNVGHQQCPPNYGWGPGMRDHYLIHYVVSGRGSFTADGRCFPVEQGQIFIARPNTVIRYVADAEDPWEYYWLGFAGPDAADLIARSGAAAQPVRSIGFGAEFRSEITAIYNARGQSAWSRTQMLGHAYLLLGKLIEGRAEAVSAEDMVQRAAGFIEDNYANRITVDDIAAYVNASPSWLYRNFVAQYGVSPSVYLRDKRLAVARQLLQTTPLRIAEIAVSVGYSDPLYFSKVFSARFGVSPSVFRR